MAFSDMHIQIADYEHSSETPSSLVVDCAIFAISDFLSMVACGKTFIFNCKF